MTRLRLALWLAPDLRRVADHVAAAEQALGSIERDLPCPAPTDRAAFEVARRQLAQATALLLGIPQVGVDT